MKTETQTESVLRSELRKGDVIIDPALPDGCLTVERQVPALPVGTIVQVKTGSAHVAIVVRREDGWYNVHRPDSHAFWYRHADVLAWVEDPTDETVVLYRPEARA